ncbi:MAG: AbrB/MazE/SpoVT family DNA-binding domain-containing protein [Thermoplasmata archaeon]
MAEAAVVRLQRVKGLTTPKKTYYRHQITVPADIIEQVGWEPGDLIGVTAKGDRVILRKRVLSPP